MKINIQKSPDNPRRMSKSARIALNASIKEFDDISGIVVNSKDDTLICGTHRYTELESIYGKDSLTLEHVIGEFHAIYSHDEFTGFISRVVDWDEDKVISANITANNTLLTGEYTDKLQVNLKKLEGRLPQGKLDQLKLSPLKINLSKDNRDEEVEQSDNEDDLHLEDDEFDIDLGNVEEKPIYEESSLIKLTVPIELKDIVRNDLLEYLSKKDYYDDIYLA